MSANQTTLKQLLHASKEGLIVQSDRELREEQNRVLEAQIDQRLELFERFYGQLATQEEKNDYYVYIDRKLRGKEINTGLYPENVREKMMQVRTLIGELAEMGVSEEVLKDLAHPHRQLSRICITKDYRIYLPEFNNIEVDLTPLPRAVFILFLKHPEGIVFKEIGDYFIELLHIYKIIMGSKFNEVRARASLSSLCDPIKNSLNEKCSRIREKFYEILSPDTAPMYCIAGVRCQPKRIRIPHTLINWDAAQI